MGRLKAKGPSENDPLLGIGQQIKATLCPWKSELAVWVEMRSPRPSGDAGGVGGRAGGSSTDRALGHRPGLSGTQLPSGPRAHADPRAVFAQGAQNYRLNPSPACTRNRRNPEPSPCCNPNRACLSCAPFREVPEPGSGKAGPLPLVFFSTWRPPDGNPRNCPSAPKATAGQICL